jgi:MoxR-like ATPase
MEPDARHPAAATRAVGQESHTELASGVQRVHQAAQAIRASVNRVIVGKEATIDLLLIALLSEGHALIEDVPGLGKTVLAKALARSLGTAFARIQGTTDLLPSDVTGVNFFSPKLSEFEFRPGPLFAQIVLVDEINRATPRTQSALLEAMQEQQVTVDGQTRPLPHPFLLIATQNPIELEGTFPLPEAQLDRFLVRVRMAYPSFGEERAMLYRFQLTQPLDTLTPVLSAPELAQLLPSVRAVAVSEPVAEYLLAIVRGTREHPAAELGGSPRAALALFRAAQAHAALRGREYVKPDDVKKLAIPVLAHRLVLSPQSRLRGQRGEDLIESVVGSTPVPTEQLRNEGR